MKVGFKVLLAFVGAISLLFVLELTGLGFFKFFEPKRENIRREIFENTQSYVHGKIQELGKYYKEYSFADSSGKKTIESVIQIQFAEFDKDKINDYQLKQFLTKTRGY